MGKCSAAKALVVVGTLVAWLMVAAAAGAATLTVTSSADSGSGSLRAMVASSASGDVVQFDPSVSSITLSSAIPITHAIVIDGNVAVSGGGLTTISGDAKTQLFTVDSPGGAVTFENLELEDGSLTIPSSAPSGGGGAAIEDTGGGGLTLTHDEFLNNTTTVDSQGQAGGGAVYETTGAIAATDVDFAANHFYASPAVGSDGGGALWANGPVTITNGTFSGNGVTGAATGTGSSNGGGALYISNSGGPVSVTNTNFDLNTVEGSLGTDTVGGGAIWAYTGGTFIGGEINGSSVSITGACAACGGGAIIVEFGSVTVEPALPPLSKTGPASLNQNSVTAAATGNFNGGGAIFDESGDISVTGTNLDGNTLQLGGA